MKRPALFEHGLGKGDDATAGAPDHGQGRVAPDPVSAIRNPKSARRGSVILLVLMTLLLTAFAMTKYLERTTVDLLADARAASNARLRVEAYSALETTLAVLAEFRTVDNGLHSPAEGWGDPLGFAGFQPSPGLTVAATVEDESGKISLPHADFQNLRDLFILLGQKQSDAERLADALLVWMRSGYEPVDSFTARAADYEREPIPCDPPGRSLHSFSELADIKYVRDLLFDDQGRPNELWHRFVDSVSLFDFNQPDINGARDTTLAAVGGYDAGAVKVIGDYLTGTGSYARQGPEYFRNAQEVAALVGGAAASPRLGTEMSCLRVNVTVREGTTSFQLSAVVAPPGGANLPPADAPPASTANADNNVAESTAPAANATGTTAAGGGSTASTTSSPPALNYPFTLLEIRENDAITRSAPATPAIE